jgi:hypothetical protein
MTIIFIIQNIAMSSQEIIKIEDDFTLIRFQNDSVETFNPTA